MRKIISLLELFAYALALIGGVGYTVYSHAYVIAVAIVALGWMALPKVKNAWKALTE